MRRIIFTLALLTLVSCATRPVDEHAGHAGMTMQAATATVRGTSVTFPSSPGEARAYLSLPTQSGKRPAIILIHEWWGLNDWVRQQADRYAADGYVALAIDLYRGKSTNDPAVAHELSRALPEDRSLADMRAAFEWLANRPDVDPSRIGSIGWCMGGGQSLALAVAEPRLAACVINYGRLVTDPAAIARIQAPILGNFGAKDQGIPPEDVNAFKAALDAAHKQNDIRIYPDAGHAFMNPSNTQGYVPSAAADAQERIDRFLAALLKP